MVNQDLVAYYQKRAQEYEKVYLNPDEQGDLLESTTIFQHLFAQKTVLEIACGTAYWTSRIAETATSVLATDINESVLEIAKQKPMGNNVRFAIADMYDFTADETYDAVFGGFIWSHILLQDLDGFLAKIKSLLKPGGTMVFIDSNYVEGSNHDRKKITHTDETGNTYQTRTLENGTAHLVLKNFPTKEFMVQKLSGMATDIWFIELKYYWIVTCTCL